MHTIRTFVTPSHMRVLSVLMFLCVADLFLTWKLIERDSTDFIESNPLAATVLSSYSWVGLGIFKLVLVATFFGLAVVVERRRPLGGLFLLIFGCGVHASVVASSVFLCYGSAEPERVAVPCPAHEKQPRLRLPIGSLALMSQAVVQEELKLTPSQIEDVEYMIAKRRELSQEIHHIQLDWCQNKMALAAVIEHSFMCDLTPAQVHRLGQLALQKRGLAALHDIEITTPLALSAEQRHAIDILFERHPNQADGRQADDTVANDDDSPANTMDVQLLRILTDEQRTLWNAMQGVPFCFRTGKSLVAAAAE